MESVQGGSLGIDTVRVGGPSRRLHRSWSQLVERPVLDPGWSMTGVSDEAGRFVPRGMLRKLDCGATLNVIAGQDHEYAFVEGSVAKVAGADNVVPLELADARPVVASMLQEARSWVEWDEPVVVNRLDVARDFVGLHDGGALVLGLSAVPLPGRKVRDVYRDPALGHAQTLFVRNKGGGCRLYDKAEETRRPEIAGRFRCEAQERRRGLRAQGVERWEDLSDEVVALVGEARFRWAGFDRAVSSVRGAVERCLAAPVTDGQRAQMLAGLQLAEMGLWDRLGNKQRRSRVRKLLEDHGCFCGEAFGGAELVQLDYYRGVQRLAA